MTFWLRAWTRQETSLALLEKSSSCTQPGITMSLHISKGVDWIRISIFSYLSRREHMGKSISGHMMRRTQGRNQSLENKSRNIVPKRGAPTGASHYFPKQKPALSSRKNFTLFYRFSSSSPSANLGEKSVTNTHCF